MNLVLCRDCGAEYPDTSLEAGRCHVCRVARRIEGGDPVASTPVWVHPDVTHARRARARLRRCRAIEAQFGDQLIPEARAMLRHIAFRSWLDCRELGFPVDAQGELLTRVRS